MGLMVLAGAGLAIGILLVVHSLTPTRPDLTVALARIGRPTSGPLPNRTTLETLARSLGMDHLVTGSVATDLRMIGRSEGAHLARCLTIGLESALVAPALVAVLALGGISLPFEIPTAMAVAMAAAGVALPNLVLGREAQVRRRGFNHALSAFLDLVAINLAAGRGIEGALDTAATAGQGWAFVEIRQALYRAKVMGHTPWTGLDDLGAELGVSDLRELAASVSLAGDNGAKVRNSLAAKAQALRIKGLADVDAAAQSASERMSLPVILLLCGFVLFIGYPAIARVLEGI
jgi:tight adherence protein C